MPIIQVTLIEGYAESVRLELSRKLTQAAIAATGASPDGISIVLNEVPQANYMRGGKSRQPGTPPLSASETVRAYLAAMEARDLDTASGFLAENFTMTFPGGACFSTPQELVKWGSKRYRFVKKTYECFDEMQGEHEAVVYCNGTLNGEWPDGTPFAGIRFIDRFEVKGGLLTDQQVWNDLAESRK